MKAILSSFVAYLCWGCCCLLGSILWACESEIESEYSRKIAFLKVENTHTITPLRAALNSPGEWCVVTVGNTALHFGNAAGLQAQMPFTASMRYAPPRCIAGFIVGTPTLPNSNGLFESRAYDAVCPSCYESASAIVKTLTLSDSAQGRAFCTRCLRSYDLQLSGIIVSKGRQDTQSNPRLYRYRHSYSPTNQMWVVQN